MSQTRDSQEGKWRKLAAQAQRETDAKKLIEIIRDLCARLDTFQQLLDVLERTQELCSKQGQRLKAMSERMTDDNQRMALEAVGDAFCAHAGVVESILELGKHDLKKK